ncbi:MAG: Ig-like domain-containing protein [Acidimicrobiales bacterium]
MRHLRMCMGVIALAIGGLLLSANGAEAVSACPPGGPQYPVGTCTLEVSPSEVQPGDEITVSGSGFMPGSTVTVTLSDGTVLGTAVVDENGNFTGVFRIPAGTEAGVFEVFATGVDPAGEPFVLSGTLTVSDATPAPGGGTPPPGGRADPPGGRLPRTGTDSLAIVGAGLALAATGLGLTLAARRRKLAVA